MKNTILLLLLFSIAACDKKVTQQPVVNTQETIELSAQDLQTIEDLSIDGDGKKKTIVELTKDERKQVQNIVNSQIDKYKNDIMNGHKLLLEDKKEEVTDAILRNKLKEYKTLNSSYSPQEQLQKIQIMIARIKNVEKDIETLKIKEDIDELIDSSNLTELNKKYNLNLTSDAFNQMNQRAGSGGNLHENSLEKRNELFFRIVAKNYKELLIKMSDFLGLSKTVAALSSAASDNDGFLSIEIQENGLFKGVKIKKFLKTKL